jgi:hypothetical protein
MWPNNGLNESMDGLGGLPEIGLAGCARSGSARRLRRHGGRAHGSGRVHRSNRSCVPLAGRRLRCSASTRAGGRAAPRAQALHTTGCTRTHGPTRTQGSTLTRHGPAQPTGGRQQGPPARAAATQNGQRYAGAPACHTGTDLGRAQCSQRVDKTDMAITNTRPRGRRRTGMKGSSPAPSSPSPAPQTSTASARRAAT